MSKTVRQMIQTDSGRFSLTKFWSFVGCGVATWIVIYMTCKDKMTWEIFLAYLGSVAGFSQVSKWLAYRYGVKADVVTATESDANILKVEKCADCTTLTKSAAELKPKPAGPAEESGD